jgi:glycosyltransferase involved in cell wall biosynthesis
MSEGISVLLCTYNGRATIGRTLAALQSQTGLEAIATEIILVDNASSDGTAELARETWTHSTIPLRIVREERAGVTFARRAGYAVARYDLLCSVDDDNFLAPDYLSRGFHFLAQHPEAGACGGCGEPLLEGEAPPWFADIADAFALGPQGETEGALSGGRDFVYGAGMFLRRAALDELKQADFPALLSGRQGAALTAGEDTELCLGLQLLGWRIVQSRALVFHHYLPGSRLQVEYVRRLYYGFGVSVVAFTLYRLFLGPRACLRPWQQFLLRWRLRRKLARAVWLYSLCSVAQPEPEGTAIFERELLRGRVEEASRQEKSGELWRHLEAVRLFARRARALRKLKTTSEHGANF